MRSSAGVVALSLAALAACSSPGSPDDRAAPVPSSRSDASASGTPDRPASSSPPSSPTPQPPEPRGYTASVGPLPSSVRDRMSFSHRPGCPVPIDQLRYLRMSYVGFDGRVRQGEMVVAARYADDVVSVFEELFEARFPIRRMVLVDEYDGDDDRSMAANNTSAYNCRRVAGTDRWSNHAFGGAIDINPVQNPYVQGSSYVPRNGGDHAFVPRGSDDRVDPGVIRADDVVVRAFERIGWEWGGTWSSSKDYQHFSADGG
jgi:hypothetical protein